jgi:hypothetical protein
VTTGAVTWNPGGSYQVEISNASGIAGTDWDLWNINGLLMVNAGTTTNSKFAIEVDSLSGLVAGPAANFNNNQRYQWLIADASAGIGGFDPAELTVDTSGFANNLGSGKFYISPNGNNLYLNFAPTPEPSTLALFGAGAIGLLGYTLRRKWLGA